MFEMLWSVLVYLVVSAVIIFIVGKLNMGLSVAGFGSAIMAAAVIAIVAGVVGWLLSLFGISLAGGFWAALINLVIAAVVLMISDKFLPGMKVNGFGGAIIAAIAIGVVGWLVTWALSLFGIVV